MDIETRPKRPEEMAPGLALDDFLPYLLNRITNRLNRNLVGNLKNIDQSLQSYRILAILTARDGRSINELAVYSVTEQPTLSRIVERMEAAGLVVRRQADRDKRVVHVHLTARGSDAYADILPLALEQYSRAVARLNSQEKDTLVALLHKVLDNIRASEFP